MSDDDRLVVTLTLTELRALVRAEVRDAIADRSPAPPPLLDRAGLARALGKSLPSIDRLRKAGLPCVKVGDVDRFELDRVLEWLRGRGERGRLALVRGVP